MPLLASIIGVPEHGERDQQTQSELLFQLRKENESLRAELEWMRNWPDDSPPEPGCYGSVSAWRNRCLVAERKLAAAYNRNRELNERIISLYADQGISFLDTTPATALYDMVLTGNLA